MPVCVLNEIMGLDMVWMLCLQSRRPFTPFAWPSYPLDLKLRRFPQPMHAFAVDLPGALEYGPSSPVAIARVVLCK